MASNIISTKQTIAEINEILAKNITLLNQGAESFTKYAQSHKLPSEYVNSLRGFEEIQKKTIKTVKELEAAEKKLEQNRLAQIKLAQQREKAFDDFARKEEQRIQKIANAEKRAQAERELQVKRESDLRQRLAKQKEQEQIQNFRNLAKAGAEQRKLQAQQEKEARLLEKTSGLYNKVQKGVNELTKRYNDLAIRKQLNGKLSAEEVVELGKLEAKLNKYQNALKAVDANIGRHQRNVGNYKSGFDGLGFSVAQLTREMPAFANSLQTGFMAISNNIPMLVDEINKLRIANKSLAAEGKPTTNVLRALGGALFSWQSLISIGVTLLTVYGAKLFEWATGMDEAEKQTKEATEELKEQNKEIEKNIALRSKQVADVRQFLNNPEINQAFRQAFAAADSQTANLALVELAERLKNIGVENADVLKDQELSTQTRLIVAGNLLEIEVQRGKLQKERQRLDDVLLQKSELDKQFEEGKISAQTRGLRLRQLGSTSLDETLKIQKEINRLEEANNGLLGEKVVLENKATKEVEKSLTSREFTVKWYEEVIAALTEQQKAVARNSTEWQFYQAAIDKANESIKRIKGNQEQVNDTVEGSIEFFEKLINTLEAQQKRVSTNVDEWYRFQQQIDYVRGRLQKLKDDIEALNNISASEGTATGENLLNRIVNGFNLDNTDDGSKKFENNWRDTFQTIADLAGQTMGLVAQISNAQFQQQFEELESQRQIALDFAGESAEAQLAVEQQFNERRREIQRKQAEAQKQQAIFDILINTASAVVRALPNIPLSVAVGALGAAQLAFVASQQIPAFWEGGVVGGEQTIMVNDDPYGKKGSNYKEVVQEPSGKLHFPTGKNVKMTVPKGSIVHPTYDAFMDSLNSELIGNNIMPIGIGDIKPMIVNNGLSKDEIKEVMSNETSRLISTINKQHGININIDENGINKYVTKKGVTSKIMNARFNGKGRKV